MAEVAAEMAALMPEPVACDFGGKKGEREQVEKKKEERKKKVEGLSFWPVRFRVLSFSISSALP